MRRAVIVFAATLVACSNGTPEEKGGERREPGPSREAAAHQLLHQRFPQLFGQSVRPARKFERAASGWQSNRTPNRGAQGWSSSLPAQTALPATANAAFRMESAGTAVDVQMIGLTSAPAIEVAGDIVYSGALGAASATYVQRALDAGTKDFLSLETRANTYVEYRLNLIAGVAGLRLIEGVLEFVDVNGTPRLRMEQPLLEGADGKIVEPVVQVSDCLTDGDPRAPWGRPPTQPGASTCTVRIDWTNKDVRYPALLDPTWLSTGVMSGNVRVDHGMSVLGDTRVLVSGGRSGTNYSSGCLLYDVSTDTWAATGGLRDRLAQHTQTTLANGKAAAIGGISPPNGTAPMRWLSVYDAATGTWSLGPDMATGRFEHAATLLSTGKIFVSGGTNGSSLASTALYDPATNAWSTGPTLGSARARHGAETLEDGRVLIAGGTNGAAALSSCQIYSPSTNTLSTTGNLLSARESFSLTQLGNGLVLVAGGNSGVTALASAELYNPNTGWFTATAPPMSGPRTRHRAVMLPPDQVLVVGGNNGSASLSTVERFRAHTSAWSAEAALPGAREGHQVVRLRDGRVLSAGSNGSERWGSPTVFSDQSTGTTLNAAWATTTGTRSATDLLSVNVVNQSLANITYTLKVIGRGLDARESTRTIGTYTIGGTPQTITFPAGSLPIQSAGTPSFAELRVEYAGAPGTVYAISAPLHYTFAAGYASVTLHGLAPKAIPGTDPAAVFGLVNGEVNVTYTTLYTDVWNAFSALSTVTGRVYNASTGDFQDVSTLPANGGPAGRVKGSYPMGGGGEGGLQWSFGSVPVNAEIGPTYTVCASWRASYVDAGYGEDYLNGGATSQKVPAAFARYTIIRNNVVRAKGYLGSTGCTNVTLTQGLGYVFLLEPVIDAGSGRQIEILARKRGTLVGPSRNTFVIKIVDTTPIVGAVVDESSRVGTWFETTTAGGTIDLASTYEDDSSRAAAVVTRALIGADSALPSKKLFVYADSICNGDPAWLPIGGGILLPPPSACATGDELFLGAFEIVNANGATTKTPTHNTRWKYVVGHEFGHVIQANLYGTPKRGDYSGGVGTRCGCEHVRNPEDKYHCLGSNEETNNAQVEGFGHFYAGKLMNDSAQADCMFVYYKPSYVRSGAYTEDPPTKRTCDDLSVKWLDTWCGGPAGRGTEWDWLNFYSSVHRGANATTMTYFGNIYKRACTGTNTLACTGAVGTPFSALSSAALSEYGGNLGDARYVKFNGNGNSAGVNH